MNSPNEYFKVCWLRRGKLTSPYANPPYMVIYKPGQWVEAPLGGLFVFDNLKSAVNEARWPGKTLVVYSCEVDGPVDLPPNLPQTMWHEAWKNAGSGDMWSRGTKAFKRVKLTKMAWRRAEDLTCSPKTRPAIIWKALE